MTTPPGYSGTETDTEGVSGNTGAASSGTQSTATNTETSTTGGFGGRANYGQTPDPNTLDTGTRDTSGAGQGTSTSFTPTSTAISGTLDTQTVGWPQTPGVTQAYRAPNTQVGYLDGTGSRDTTWTDRPLSDGSTRPDLMTTYTGTLDSYYVGAPTGPVGTGVPAAPGAAPTVAAGPGQITVNWTAVADPANAPVRGYVIRNSTGGTIFAGRADRSAIFDTVVPDQAYTFTVAARNDNGTGPFSAVSASVSAWNSEEADVSKPGGLAAANSANPIYKPDGTVVAGSGTLGTPGAPTGVTLAGAGAGKLNATWVAPTTGGKVVSYTVTLSTGQTLSVASTVLTAQFTGLTTGTATTARVTAVGTVFNTQSAASASVNVP